ncbi:MAG: hypothetical protein IJ560_04055, partial [Alphaproteobacteria bacterium]|nr:hypothetical protein [Alphaproteobacteria bacterium]
MKKFNSYDKWNNRYKNHDTVNHTCKLPFIICSWVAMCIGMGASHAATCDAGYWLDGTACEACVFNRAFYCPGDDIKYNCPTEPIQTAYIDHYTTWVTQNGQPSKITNCRLFWSDVPVANGKIHFGGFWSISGHTYSTGSMQVEYTHSKCNAGYYMKNAYGENGLQYYVIKDYDNVISQQHCFPVEYGYYSGGDTALRTACPAGTYTTTETAAAASDCTPCTNAPANAHYTAANTTDGTPNCEWECDAGFGHTSDDRCLP